MTHLWPGGTEEQYRVNIAAVHPEGGLVGPPEERSAEAVNVVAP